MGILLAIDILPAKDQADTEEGIYFGSYSEFFALMN